MSLNPFISIKLKRVLCNNAVSYAFFWNWFVHKPSSFLHSVFKVFSVTGANHFYRLHLELVLELKLSICLMNKFSFLSWRLWLLHAATATVKVLYFTLPKRIWKQFHVLSPFLWRLNKLISFYVVLVFFYVGNYNIRKLLYVLKLMMHSFLVGFLVVGLLA